ncbi:oligosaccharide 4-alpha-D-glucosyltransferase-like [Aricia agestis]|uniref:oligosaccharide 4-alpha-D-glucosyltransferase-like n=1 Tax=Aricia agestis TaxID=91739 RepID=UPI001C20875F|nr:oligosaccharide 4-alpha-D-glucosyltransferase-like [Aricia agestis]XP_041972508.1 oligosaccharide 4-alpha-D-glucosyltransferase-like [Aricia agestis]
MAEVTKDDRVLGNIIDITKTSKYFLINFGTGEEARLYVLKDHVLRYYISTTKIFLEYPKPNNETDVAKIIAKTLDDYGDEAFQQSELDEITTHYIVKTKALQIVFAKRTGTIKVNDKRSNKDVLIEAHPLSYNDQKCKQTLHQRSDEYFFGGGMQNGRFTHKGKKINIVNSNKWTDGWVSSPCPFYWSTYGYGILRNTWQKGSYDFGEKKYNDVVETTHEENYYDAYIFINSKPADILKDYFELTGKPLLLPEYAFYESHFNAFNRDYWVEVNADTKGAILFEDGKYYKSYQPKDIGDKIGILESLNGEKNNYQFSARAMLDRYERHDIPLGWFIPNDGYGSGYGQTDSLDGDIENLRQFSTYCKEKGVQLALWTESNLHPADPSNPKKGERDLNKEVGVANVVALKCDEAWIGQGYSFGLNAIEYANGIFNKATKSRTRPMILSIDGWAGTQRYAGIWSGDQNGGEWEYIRFHIPTYIGTGLSGQPIVGSDMDGIYAGGNKEVNIRDFQWKAFTPLQLNMDGWGNTPKTPFSYDEEATDINRAYLKLKSMLMPYNYSIAFESINGLPMIRALFLEFANDKATYTTDCQYEFMWGPNILVAPIYNGIKSMGQFLRNGIYLPDENQMWMDFFTGEKYQGGKVYNNILTPLWKIPVFVREGCIIPMTNPNNNPNQIDRSIRIFTVYPRGGEKFKVYEDDGITKDYDKGEYATTEITVGKENLNDVVIKINKTTGTYKTMVKNRSTILQIMATEKVGYIKTAINGESVDLQKAANIEQFKNNDNNMYYFNEEFVINPYLTKYNIKQKFISLKISTLDITQNEIIIKLKGHKNDSKVFGRVDEVSETIAPPSDFKEDSDKRTSTNIVLTWKSNDNIEYYEIDRDGIIFTHIKGDSFTFEVNNVSVKYNYRLRAIVGSIASKWSNSIEV